MESLALSPWIHWHPGRSWNPLNDRETKDGEETYRVLARLRDGSLDVAVLDAADRERLRSEGWLEPVGGPAFRGESWRLKGVSLETHTVCNQACYFCPVSIEPREAYFMPTELFERIVRELEAFRETIECVFLINYNEPTIDRRFVDQCRALFEARLPVGVLSNGTGLTPARVDALLSLGRLRWLSINLSTIDRDRYKVERGADQLDLVLRNLDYLKDKPLADETDMAVLGTGDERHRNDYEAIRKRFEGSRFNVKSFEVMDRAGHLPIGSSVAQPHETLRGCENLGSRPLNHLHITPQGRCIFCCEDYSEKYVVGDLTKSTVQEVLSGEELARLRRWTYGLEEAPADFVCRKCVFARAAEPLAG